MLGYFEVMKSYCKRHCGAKEKGGIQRFKMRNRFDRNLEREDNFNVGYLNSTT
jgi:hypothetical protein